MQIICKERQNKVSEYIIVTDSACDLPEELIKELDVAVMPIHYTLDGKTYENDPSHSEYPISKFYADIKAGKPVSTAALNIADIEDFITPYLKDGKDVIYLVFSSGLSSTYQNAFNTMQELCKEYPERRAEAVDTLCASMGQGLLVYLCAKKKQEGASFEEVVEYANDIKLKICHEVTVDDLGQLKRGGRISPTTAFFGSMLQIKPMIYISPEGKLVPYDKRRGRQAALKLVADKIIERCCDEAETPVFISHGDCEDDAAVVMELIKEKLPNKKFHINHIGPVIGAHSGYKTLAAFCVSENVREIRA